jgi:dolichyl-phosphate beta-glucosyltransferase
VNCSTVNAHDPLQRRVALKSEIVIPCFNEIGRLDPDAVGTLIERRDLTVLLVNDGSSDGTWDLLRRIQVASDGKVDVLGLMSNMGKAEAVRRGLNHAIDHGAAVVGYLDADFSTPPGEMHRLLDVMAANAEVNVLMGSRWLHLGADIRRSTFRHYAGRVFATVASNILRMRVYDTQCGAKLLRVTENLKAALDRPFLSRWAFDVELIGRLREGVGDKPGYPLEAFLEVPLDTWINVEGSKLGWRDIAVVAFEMISIGRGMRRLRKH